MTGFSRRDALALAAVAAASPAVAATPSSLDRLARAGGRRFGSTVGIRNGSFDDPRYTKLLADECSVTVPENELKWGWIRPGPTTFEFSGADRIITFAEKHGLAVRGHTLLWHHPGWFPKWVATYDFGARPAGEAARMIHEHVAAVCTRYDRRIYAYDVVNEAVDNRTGALRETAFSRAMGSAEAVLDLAFRTARRAAPHALLCYNDYMAWEPWNAVHRDGVLRLLEGFRKRGTPVHALGIQSHIGTENSDDSTGFGTVQESAWRRFLDEVVAMDYRLVVTEFDVHDKGLPADIAARDRAVADYGRAYLDLMLSYPQLGDFVAWGLSDRYSWLQDRWPRPDRLPKRPCPYDADFRPKPLREAMAEAFRSAPSARRTA